jgi:TetR/AcrR family transcriptional regulator
MARPRAAGYDDQRAAILAQAARLFAVHGFPSTTMSQVAQATGLSKAALYHYVRDKDQLLAEIAHAQLDALHALVEAVLAEHAALGTDEPRTLMRALIEGLVIGYADARDAHRVLSDEVRYLAPAEHARIVERQRALVAVLADALARWQPQQAAAGLSKPLTMLLFGMVNWLFTWMRPDGALDHRQLAPIVADLFLAGVPCVTVPASLASIDSMADAPSPAPLTPAATGSSHEPVADRPVA